MGVLSKFLKWLRGEKSPPSPSEIRANLRIIERRLIRYENELKAKRKKALSKARESLRAGDIELARELARQSIIYERNLKNVMALRAKIENLRSMVERGAIISDLQSLLRDLMRTLAFVSASVGDKELLKIVTEVAKANERLSIAEERMLTGLDLLSEGDELETEELLAKLAKEEGIEIAGLKEEIKSEDIDRLLNKILKEGGE